MLDTSEIELWAVVGCSGSGKTTVAEAIARFVSEITHKRVTVFSQDSTLIETHKRRGPNLRDKFHFPMANRILRRLLTRKPACFCGFSQSSRRRDQKIRLAAGSLIIVEGVLALEIPVVQERARHKVWMDVPPRVCEERQWRRYKNDGWYQGLSEKEVRKRILEKCTKEVPVIQKQRALCNVVVDNSRPLSEQELFTIAWRLCEGVPDWRDAMRQVGERELEGLALARHARALAA